MTSNVIAAATAGTAWILSLMGAGVPAWLQRPLRDSWSGVYPHELAPLLSPTATIYLPGSEGFELATDRWNPWKSPHFDIVVEVVTEDDASHTIRYAKDSNKPFLAISGKHGANVPLAGVQHGVGISMASMTDVRLANDGQSAVVGGGIKSKKLVHDLWDLGKQTVVGCCECTGVTAAVLGGGHGWLQGRYGLMSDNLISARLVLANGSVVTVSADDHPDLFWGIQGAGHNFGIVTSFEYKVYDRTTDNENWAIDTLVALWSMKPDIPYSMPSIFTADKIEQVHAQAKRTIGGSQPVELIHFILWTRIANIDPTQPVILFVLLYQGKEISQQYLQPLLDLQPVVHNHVVTDLPGIAPVVQFSESDPACQNDGTLLRFPVSLETYDIPALRKAFDQFSNISAPFRERSTVILEGYSTHAVQAVAEGTTAYPDRGNNLLISPFIWFESGVGLDEEGAMYGKRIRDALVKASGKPLNAYINYAYGDETQAELYGEPWRLERLQELKRKYDPSGRFSYYNPIKI